VKRFELSDRIRAGVGVALGALLLGGCAAERAEPLSLGETVRLEAIDPERVRDPLDEERSITTFDRSGWAPVVFAVPIDERVTPGAPSKRLAGPNPTPRRRGAYPTPLTAIEPAPIDASTSVTAVMAPIGSAIDLPVILLRAVFGDNRSMDEALENRERAAQPEEIGVEDVSE